MLLVCEYHGGQKCLTRVRLRYRFVTTTIIINLFFLALIIYRGLSGGGPDLILVIPYALFLLVLMTRARRLKRRVAEIVDAAAFRLGLERITRRRHVAR